MWRILLVEDEPGVTAYVAALLRKEGCDVSVAPTVSSAVEQLADGLPDLVLVDIELPDGSGLDVVTYVRRRSATPVIVVSGRTSEMDKVVGLELGADDYIVKPFRNREFVARIRRALHRASQEEFGNTQGEQHHFRGWILDAGQRLLLDPSGAAVDLTFAEFELLLALVQRPQVVLSREDLREAISNRALTGPDDRSVDVRIGRLREKLGDDAANPRLIRTVRGAGYMFLAGGSARTDERH